MIDQYIEDRRVYITVGSDSTEVECDLSLPDTHGQIPCVIMEGSLMGFEILLDRAFILSKAPDEQDDDDGSSYWTENDEHRTY